MELPIYSRQALYFLNIFLHIFFTFSLHWDTVSGGFLFEFFTCCSAWVLPFHCPKSRRVCRRDPCRFWFSWFLSCWEGTASTHSISSIKKWSALIAAETCLRSDSTVSDDWFPAMKSLIKTSPARVQFSLVHDAREGKSYFSRRISIQSGTNNSGRVHSTSNNWFTQAQTPHNREPRGCKTPGIARTALPAALAMSLPISECTDDKGFTHGCTVW